jgi:DNA-binding response OmpR family regulator
MLHAEMANPCSVLITEDDPAIRILLAAAMRRRRLSVATAPNGQEALELLQRHHWMVLILDLMMPSVTGWEVIAWLAAHRDRKPGTVIVASATDRQLLREVDPSVVNALFFKPFDIKQLTAYVKASCELEHRDRRRSRVIGLSEQRA